VVRRSTICRAPLTPSIQKRTKSKLKVEEVSDYEKARIKLHVTNTPDCLPCRENQFSDIYTFIETNLKNQTGGVLYICGVPGTGKTLTVKQVILCLYESVRARLLPNFKFIDVNAFQVTEPHQIYKLIYKVTEMIIFQESSDGSLKKILPKGADGGKCVGRTRHDAFGEKIRAEIE
jgi:origin recognition complex subunit 1